MPPIGIRPAAADAIARNSQYGTPKISIPIPIDTPCSTAVSISPRITDDSVVRSVSKIAFLSSLCSGVRSGSAL